MRPIRSALLLLLPALLACEGEAPLLLTPIRAVVYGTVRSPAGVGIPNAAVSMRSDAAGQCPARDVYFVGVPTVKAMTDGSGSFRGEVILFRSEFDLVESTCVRLDITAPQAAALRDTSLSVGRIHYSAGAASDSVRAEVVLRNSP